MEVFLDRTKIKPAPLDRSNSCIRMFHYWQDIFHLRTSGFPDVPNNQKRETTSATGSAVHHVLPAEILSFIDGFFCDRILLPMLSKLCPGGISALHYTHSPDSHLRS
ncbi:hypothetical protein ILYODFUR_034118 [Ilyodon furcidens]|uniref:Uncharacterized protein n=1 Tax=Ilyodon furcidens TaxID=33524 RepID=A0ABV0V066_9TELE